MVTLTSFQQRRIDAEFEEMITQHTSELSPAWKDIVTQGPHTVLHHFNYYKQVVSPETLLRHRNELARGFMVALRSNNWDIHPHDSRDAAAIADWLMTLRTGKNSGGYLHDLRAMLLLACNRLHVADEQKNAWREVIRHKPAACPRDIAQQSVNALPRPALRDVRTRD